MAAPETHLEMSVRHVAEQENRIVRQGVLIEHLQKVGVPIEDALELLCDMQIFLEDMRAHVRRISN